MTATLDRPVEPGAAPPLPPEPKTISRWWWALGVMVIWIGVWAFTKGTQTLALPAFDQSGLHENITDFGNWVRDNRDTNPLMILFGGIADAIDAVVEFLQSLLSTPTPPRPAPQIGWVGVVAIFTWIGYAVANWRIALLVFCSFLSFGIFGFWQDSIDLLIVTIVSVSLAVIIGMPLAIWLALSPRASRWITLLLDLLQTMPTFVYLIFVILFFGIGPPAAVICTLAYALPPIVRIAGFGIKDVSPTTIEATDSQGQTTWQRLFKVQLPMARRTIIVGLNQTILAALSMAIIAAFINGPGLGKPVLSALTKNDFGGGLVPGLLIVLMGIMLDRTTTAASERAEIVARGGGEDRKRRMMILGGSFVGVLVAIWYSRYSLNAAVFPEFTIGRTIADAANTGMEAFTSATEGVAEAFKDLVSYGLLNPIQSLLAESPWWLSFLGITALAIIVGGRAAIAPALICLTAIYFLDLWNETMLTLTMTLVATVMVMILALIVGVWMARSHRADLFIRPVLDAGQSIPAFVYLLPVLALFGPTRFTAIVAGVIYAAPAAIKLVADGIRSVSPTTIEAGRSTGSTTWQEIIKVQLPMSRGALLLATNQGLLYVLSMVVIGGMVGAQALGYTVLFGVAQSDYFGKGLAAGFSIVLLGIMIDRIARAAAARQGPQVLKAKRRLQMRGPAAGAH